MKKTITLVLDETETAMLEALALKYGKLASPTSIVHSAANQGLIRLAVQNLLDPKALGVSDLDVQTALLTVTAKPRK